jgi:upstream activation factor subunit UAF30
LLTPKVAPERNAPVRNRLPLRSEALALGAPERKNDHEAVFPLCALLLSASRLSSTKPITSPLRGGDSKSMAAKKTTKKAAGAKRKPNAAFMKAMTPSAILAEVVGNKPIPRTEVVKRLWAYIKKNGLQDAKERRMINADDKLKAVFGGKKQVSMFEMTKLVNKQLS